MDKYSDGAGSGIDADEFPDRGLFIVLEGVDGCGKTTAAQMLVTVLEQQGHTVLHTREPGGTLLAEGIRTLMIIRDGQDQHKPSSDTLMLLLFAARQDHLEKKILPALERGEIVVCERWSDSTYAYQVMGQHGDEELFDMLDLHVRCHVRPDCVLYLNISQQTQKERLAGDRKLDDIERSFASDDFFHAVHTGFAHRRRDPLQVKVSMNGALPIDEMRDCLVSLGTAITRKKYVQHDKQGTISDFYHRLEMARKGPHQSAWQALKRWFTK